MAKALTIEIPTEGKGRRLISRDVHEVLPQLRLSSRSAGRLSMWALADGSVALLPSGFRTGSRRKVIRTDNRPARVVRYTHAADGQDYEHEFRYPVRVRYLDGGAIVLEPTGNRSTLWGEF
jgi:hypothetical protein